VNWQEIVSDISETTGFPFQIKNKFSISGGCINEAYCIEGNGERYFIKLNSSDYLDMFEAEATGLKELQQAIIKVPQPLCWGIVGKQSYLVIEHIVLQGETHLISADLGQKLATLHQVTQPQFGWQCNNYIGSTPQINNLENDWVSFWQQYRLGFQLKLAARNGYGGKLQTQGERLIADIGYFFSDYQPQASLLHGDLWSGNYAVTVTPNGAQPVIYDPAVYYGDRETDIAMTELFGGFSKRFYQAYQETWPLDVGYKTRKKLYNLYHILNHLNLFGSGYLNQAETMIASLLSEY
jgi:fructosamine-3-kinase